MEVFGAQILDLYENEFDVLICIGGIIIIVLFSLLFEYRVLRLSLQKRQVVYEDQRYSKQEWKRYKRSRIPLQSHILFLFHRLFRGVHADSLLLIAEAFKHYRKYRHYEVGGDLRTQVLFYELELWTIIYDMLVIRIYRSDRAILFYLEYSKSVHKIITFTM